jgi:hypothetical protein
MSSPIKKLCNIFIAVAFILITSSFLSAEMAQAKYSDETHEYWKGTWHGTYYDIDEKHTFGINLNSDVYNVGDPVTVDGEVLSSACVNFDSHLEITAQVDDGALKEVVGAGNSGVGSATFNNIAPGIHHLNVYYYGRNPNPDDPDVNLEGQRSIEFTVIASPYPYVDKGLRVFDGTKIVKIALYPQGVLGSPLRIEKDSLIYSVALVEPTDSDATKVRVRVSNSTKALREYKL